MIAELGHFALTLAFAVALFQMSVPLIGAAKGWSDWMKVAAPAAMMQFLLVGFSFAALTHAFVTSDFSVRIVAENSHSLKPALYKFTGTWGNHEGSMLLWVLILTVFGAMVAAFGRDLPLGLKSRALAVQAMIAAAFFAFILFTSNPFDRLFPAPPDGRDLNPLLQDIGLAIHPPFLYLGYVGLSMAFSFAVAALIEGRVDAAWARWVRPWTLAAWICLTIGIALGSYWAYYELGWGGWWFWDPVENASFMPWLIACALLHSAIVVEKRSSLKVWTILLAILAFSLSLIGTFIVRSGVLTSVHAFANDPERGVFILAILVVAIVGSLTLFAWRAPSMRSEGVFQPISREGALIFNNLLLGVACAVVFIGTLAPLVREFFDGSKISVGAPFFDLAFTPFMVILMLGLPIGAMLPWKRADALKVISKLWWAAAGALVLGGIVWGLSTGGSMVAPVGMALTAWLLLGVLTDLVERSGFPRVGVGAALGRLLRLPRADWGKAFAHAGLGLTVMGITAVTAWEVEDIRLAKPGDVIPIGPYEVRFESVERLPLGASFDAVACGTTGESVMKGGDQRNFETEFARFSLLSNGERVAFMCPEKRFYPVQQQPTTEAAIDSGLLRDVYLVLGDRQANGESWAVRAYWKPLANWIWLGCFVMAFGGLMSLSDRRFRVGAAARRAKAGGARPVPAE
ncbi:heme lyase CcmF/NrfE family subunit [Rhodobacteraceae bacterium NNCM2]|nr:heme lyase CcmF/NrfE family subunit [Coraliihabitans acroporae]